MMLSNYNAGALHCQQHVKNCVRSIKQPSNNKEDYFAACVCKREEGSPGWGIQAPLLPFVRSTNARCKGLYRCTACCRTRDVGTRISCYWIISVYCSILVFSVFI